MMAGRIQRLESVNGEQYAENREKAVTPFTVAR
jgi:hypothetical protein